MSSTVFSKIIIIKLDYILLQSFAHSNFVAIIAYSWITSIILVLCGMAYSNQISEGYSV